MNYTDLGARIRAHRLQHGLTQEGLAELIDVSTPFVGHVERGSRKASLETLVRIANALNVSVDWLLSASLNRTVVGPMPAGLSESQRKAMREILDTLHDAVA